MLISFFFQKIDYRFEKIDFFSIIEFGRSYLAMPWPRGLLLCNLPRATQYASFLTATAAVQSVGALQCELKLMV